MQVFIEGERTSQNLPEGDLGKAKLWTASEIQEREAQKKAFHPEE